MMIQRWIGRIIVCCAAIGVAGWCHWSHADPADGRPAADAVDFQRDVFPILAERCFACHGPDLQEGHLRLDARATVLQGGVSGKLIEPGDGAASLLYERIVDEEAGDRMPLDDDPLGDQEIALIRRWIDQGARWPEGVGAAVDSLETHWAYVKPRRAALPTVSDPAWIQSPIDAFVLARLDREGLTPSPAADRAKLLRRVSLDLIGVPPSPEEVDAFLHDSSPDAYQRVVDRLLASPEYAVKWARAWLDLARYADTNGYQADQFRSVWPYRDWVVDAMNRDMPFDQFTIEQLAGDLLPNATLDQRIATGFHRLTTCNVEAGVDPEENRVNQIVDRVNTTGSVWLGTSIECGQCHSHKYDPFSQREYYQLFAYFNNTPLEVEGNGVTYNFVGPAMPLPLSDDRARQRAELEGKRSELQQQLDARTKTLVAKQADWESSLAAVTDGPEWHMLKIDSFTSTGGASHTILDDGSVLVGGERPSKDVYVVEARSEWTGITGFKLETLTDPSLPGNGPGRHHADRPNFILNDFQVMTAPCEGEEPPTPVGLHTAQASFSQARWDVAGTIDGDPATGWGINPEFHKPHFATFLTAEPIGFDGGTRLIFTLDQHHGDCRTIGRLRLSAMTGQPAEGELPANVAQALAVSAAKRTKQQVKELRDHYLGLDADVKRLGDEIAKVKKQLDAVQPETTLVMIEQDEPRTTHLMRRGNFLDPGEAVEPGTPRVLHAATDDLPPNRLGLARWLAHEDNPLTPRVVVNRWWADIFGRGIVATLEDFGSQSEPPTHPELLDWLACEFRDHGWSMKHVHRLIVTSSTYRQSGTVPPELWQRDQDNRLLARGPRFRLPAESVRDNSLAISGLLVRQLGGPPIFPPQPDGFWRHVGRNEPKYDTSEGTNRFRRGVYVYWRRSAPYPSFTNFDAPDRASCTIARPRTNTPLQALTLLNDPAYVEMAVALAERIASESPSSDVDMRVRYGFQLCTAREPSDVERQHLADVFRREFERFRSDEKAARLIVGQTKSTQADVAELAAWFYVANILLNLDETITK